MKHGLDITERAETRGTSYAKTPLTRRMKHQLDINQLGITERAETRGTPHTKTSQTIGLEMSGKMRPANNPA